MDAERKRKKKETMKEKQPLKLKQFKKQRKSEPRK